MATITVDRSINADDAFAMSGGIAFVALPSGSATYQTQATGITTWATATIVQSSAWQAVCYGNNLVVAVSSTSGTIAASSPAGATNTWTLRTMPVTASWYAVKYGLDKFVATAGGGSTAGAYSPDGAKWTSTGALPVSGDWRALEFGNSRFVAVSYGSTDSAYSTNGTSWTAGGALPAVRNWTDMVYGESTFVAIASGTDKGAYSTDGGVSWNEMTMPSSSNWRSITYGNGTFVAVSNTSGTIAASSPDGITWTARTLPATAVWVGVAFGNNLFTAVSTSSTNAATSPDGLAWDAIAQLSQAVSCIAYTPTTWNSNDTLAITNNATVTVNTDQKKFWNAITLTNGKLHITNNSTSTGIRFTMGRVSGAAAANITPGSGIGDVEITGNWIELGTGDGTSGQEMTAPFTDYISTLWVETASGSGVYEVWLNATGAYGDTSPTLMDGLAAVSKDERGKFFIQQAATAPYGPTIINCTDGSRAQRLLTVTSTTGLYPGASVLSVSGIPASTVVNRVISSTQIEINNQTTTEISPDWSSVAFGNSTYVAVSSGYSNVAATSSDGVTWTKRTLPFIADWTDVRYGATSALFVAVASHSVYGIGYCATSPDGITWTQRAMPAVMNWASVATNGTSFVAVGATAANAATTIGASSTDGITWVATVMTSAIWRSVTYGAGAANRYVAVSSTTISNWDADGAGTWTNGGAMTSANYLSIGWNGTRFFACSGSSTVSMYSTNAVSWTTGAVLANSTSRGVSWDGTNFVIVSTTNSVNTSRTPNGSTAVTNTTMAVANANNWTAICANGTTLVAVSNSSNLRSAAMTSTDSGANWTLQTGIPLDVSLTCFNPYVSQLTDTIEFGDNINGNKVPTGAKVRCPNIMFTADTPANIQTASRLVGANMVMSNGGSLTANICLFDESYNNFLQAEIVSLTNVGFTLPPLLQECYNVSMNSVGFALEPVRRYYQFSATVGSNAWFSRETRYGSGTSNVWNYINGATINDLNMAVGQPFALVLSSGAGSVSAPNACLYITNTSNSTWTNIRFYGLGVVRNFQAALSLTSLFNDNTITNFESYGLSPYFLGVSNNNTITNTSYSEDMFNGYKNFTTAARIGIDPIAGAHLVDDTKYYLKIRTFKDWTDRSVFAESRVYSATPYLGYKYHPQSLSVYNSAARAVTLTWVRREPTSAIVAYTIYRGTSPAFTRNSASRIFYSPTSTVVAYTNGYVAQVTGAGGRTLQFAQAGRTITASSGSFITDGFLAGANVVVAGTTSNNGTYMILSLTATVITLTTNHTNLVNEGPISAGTLNGQVPDNGSTYYYRLEKYEAANAGITNAAGTAAGTTLTIPSGSFNTGLGTVINCEGTSGSTKVRLPIGSTTNFLAANVMVGMQISGGGVGASATVVSIDTAWQITLSVANASTFVGQTLSKGAAAGMYIYGPGIAWPTKVVSVDSATSITVDTAFLATFTGQTINFMYGSESAEFECYVTGPTTPAFNYLTYADDFSNAAWVKTNSTVVVDQSPNLKPAPSQVPYAVAASLTGVGDRLTSNGPSGRVVQTVADLESGAAYNFSVYVITDVNAQIQTVSGQISINTTSPTTQAFTATGAWQRISANFTATSDSHTFTIQINTEGAYIYIATANLVPGSSALAPITNTTVKKAAGAGGRTLTFASAGTVHTITASTGSFTTDGFVAGDSIIVAGTTSNDGQYVLATVAATVLTITPAQPLVAEGPISVGHITGSVLAAAAQELTLAAAWSRSLGGNDTNQGIELTLATAPANAMFSEIYLGTASGFTPSDYNRVGYITQPGSHAPVSLSNASDNRITGFTQIGYGGISGALITLVGSSSNTFQDFEANFNYAANTSMVLSSTALSNDNVFDDFTINNWRNYISAVTPFTFLNNASGVALQNINFNHYDIPFYTSATNSALGVVMKGVSGGNADAITTATTYALGSAVDGVGISFTAVYDTIFHEMFYSPTRGTLQLRFNASAEDDPPYEILAGEPAFSNTGRLYLRTAGDSIEFTWPHRIYTVSGFRDLLPKWSSLDLGHTSSLDAAFSIKLEYAIDTGAGYGAYQTATPANLASETVSTTTGFFLKLKITARPGMMFSGKTNAFVVGETIRGVLSGVTAVIDEVYDLTTTTGTIILSSVSGTFIATENIVRDSDSQTRATNVVTNTQFATFPSFNSYVDGLEIFTNTVGPGDYPGTVVSVTLTNVVSGSTYYIYKTSGLALLGSGTAASSTVTIPGIAYTADFGITVRVRKASAAPKYIPLETQATVNSAGASVYIGQLDDAVVGASVNGTIAGDLTIDTTTKTIRHTADTVVYTVNELYTWLMDYFDDITTIDDTIPISAQTPTEYTLTNGWFMDNTSFKYLSGGAVQTDGQDSYSTHVLIVTGGTYADPVSGDISKTVMAGATTIGPLLDYEIISAGVSSKWYVRDTRVVPAVIASTTVMTITTGTGSGNNSANSLSGENIWSNVFSLGTIVSGTTLDLYQNDSQITPWWSAGQIDILVKVKEAGTEIDSGNLTVLARKYSTLYDHYVVDASTGRNPVPLAAFTDTNNQVAEGTVGAYAGITFDFGAASKDLGNGNGSQPYDCVIDCNSLTIQEVYEYLKYVTRTGSGTTLNGVNGEYYQAVGDIRLSYSGEASGPFVEGNAITSSAGGTGYIVSLIDGGATGTLVIRNVHGTFADTNTLTSSGTTATISGTPDTILQSKQAPFGVFSGGKLFGARGVWLENVAAADSINYQLIDSLGVTQIPPISVTVTVKDANSLAAVESARVLLEAAAGGDLPAGESCTITRSGGTASVAHTAHGMTSGMSVIIRGAAQDEYNGIYTISNVTADAYDYTVSGSPATPATGTITATCAILNGATNGSGILQVTTFNYTSDQPIGGRVRRATTGAKYKTGAITGTITSTGLNTTVLLILDE